MQLICEAYAILKNVLGLEAKDLADIFAQWNCGALESYLIEITAEIFRKRDPDTAKALVDVILDKAGQKGTGLWTLQSALSQSVVISTINAAVEARVISSRKGRSEERRVGKEGKFRVGDGDAQEQRREQKVSGVQQREKMTIGK